MLTVDEQKHPIYYLLFDGTPTAQDTEAHLASWERWLSEGESFGVIQRQVGVEAGEGKPPKEGHKLEVDFFRRNRPRIAGLCFGVAVVLDSEAMLDKWQPLAAKAIENMVGCTGRAFGTVAEAVQWLEERQIAAPPIEAAPGEHR
ncbi:hypothetical protein [Gloeobacter violaceus]|uniref:Gll0323 protein n=1 Tax=Gloeobacter violaceus (strain ATCC 29082 / PCC 7421) TaxID=251221 RepID=Q7NNT6_GLOVI|nr:hypothetical protein [Gloeobacter violaceus]BAC88264.1 gll0323 [Gloeobacter violaceus PCC 7421]